MNKFLYKSRSRIKAKSLWRKLPLTLLTLFTSLSFMVFDLPAKCQDQASASLSEKGYLQIPTSQPLSSTYVFDLAKYKFKSDTDLIEFLSTRSGDFFSVRSNGMSNQGALILHLNGHPQWTSTDWNRYLMEATVAHPLKPE